MTARLKKYEMTWFIADKEINKWMCRLDLRESFKWFIVEKDIVITTTKRVNAAYINNLIEKSKDDFQELGFWIPAIIYKNKLYRDKGVKELSNGRQSMFIADKERA